MATSELRLRGYAERQSNGWWYVHCIDLTLDALAPTYEEARSKLDEATHLYLDVLAEDGLTGKNVLRPSPLEFRLRYWRAVAKERARRAMTWLKRRLKHNRTARGDAGGTPPLMFLVV